jgi:hypothetical protein
MFRPNLTCQISTMGEADGYGKRVYSPWKNARFGIVKLERGSKRTSVRTDASASRAFAQEILADSRLLFPKNVILKPGDRVRFLDFVLTVESVFPRVNVIGNLDHWQVDLTIWNG